jgi:hypothetical protein
MMCKRGLLILVIGLILTALPLQAQGPDNLLPAPLVVEMGAIRSNQPRGKIQHQPTGQSQPTQTNQWTDMLLYAVLPDTLQTDDVHVELLDLHDNYVPFWWTGSWNIAPDRRSILIRLEQPLTEGEIILQVDNYYAAASEDLPLLVDLSAYNEFYTQTVSYRLSSQLHYAAGIAGHDLVVGDLTREQWLYTPLENWLPHNIEIKSAGVTFDPLERQVFVRVAYSLPVSYLTRYISFLVDLTAPNSEPEPTDLLWLNWSPDGQYAIAAGPDNNLTLLDGDMLAPVLAADNIPITLADVVDFTWHPDGSTGYYIQISPSDSGLYALDFASGEHTRLTIMPYSRHYPSFAVSGGGDFGLLTTLPGHMESHVPYRYYIDLHGQDTGELPHERYPMLQSLSAPRLSPTQDWAVAPDAIAGELYRYFWASQNGVQPAHHWYGMALVRGWTADGAPIIQTLDPAMDPDAMTDPPDSWRPLPDPGWYALDMDAEGNLLWEAFDCGAACNIAPADFDRPVAAQCPDDPLIFAVEGSGPNGEGLHLVNLHRGTAHLLMAYGQLDEQKWMEWQQVLRIEWLAPDAFPQPGG